MARTKARQSSGKRTRSKSRERKSPKKKAPSLDEREMGDADIMMDEVLKLRQELALYRQNEQHDSVFDLVFGDAQRFLAKETVVWGFVVLFSLWNAHMGMFCGFTALQGGLMGFAISINSAVRINFPSCYVPASRSSASFISSPIFARILATVAEFIFYAVEARAFGLAFCNYDDVFDVKQWGALCVLTTLGETICWSHIILQSELLGWIEDSTWAFLQLCATVLPSAHNGLNLTRMLIPSIFATYMLVNHLPRMFLRVRKAPFIGKHSPFRCPVENPDTVTLAWQIPSLVAKPIVYSLFLISLSIRDIA